MNSPYQAPSTPPAPPKDPARGSLLLGFLLGWGAVFGGYVVLGGLAALLFSVAGNSGNNGIFMLLPLLYALPWAAVLGLIVWFAVKNQPRSALGVVLAIASMVGLAILLVAACFGLFALSGNWH